MINNQFRYIFLITVDCLRADYVDCILNREDKFTPNINRFSKNSIIFTRAFANGPGTNQSFPAILTSTYFLMHGGMRLLPYYTTIAEILSKHNFRTVAFHSNPFLSGKLGWSKGFHEFYDFIDIVKSPSAFVTKRQEKVFTKILTHLGTSLLQASKSTFIQRFLKNMYYRLSHFKIPYIEAKKLNEYAINWIEKNLNKKFFMWIHYMDPHYPYIPPEEYLEDFSSRQKAFEFNLSVNYNNPSKDENDIFKKLYAGEVKYTDACIGEFLNYLEQKNILKKSLIILAADHGHAFMEHKRFGHAFDILYNEVLHVPLIIHGLSLREKINLPVQLLDIPPTIVDLLKIKRPRSFMGESLLGIIKGGHSKIPIFSESAKPDLINLRYKLDKLVVSCIVDMKKLIINQLLGTSELYDLKKDFGEKENIIQIDKKTSTKLESLIEKHISTCNIHRKRASLKSKLKQ